MKLLSCIGKRAVSVVLLGLVPLASWANPLGAGLHSEPFNCLTANDKLLPEIDQQDSERTAFTRIKLKFSSADLPPEIEWLHSTGDNNYREQVQRYVASYRLPCFQASQGPVEASQEFELSADPSALAAYKAAQKLCLVQPTEALYLPDTNRRSTASSVAVKTLITFKGDGKEAPEVEILASTGDSRIKSVVKSYASQYRMPCRQKGDPPAVTSQVFRAHFDDAVTDQAEIGLVDFLGLVNGVESLHAKFDFNTMSCPFKLRLEIWQPILSKNDVSEVGVDREGLHRAVFKDWISKLPLKLGNHRQASDMIGSALVVSVPCGTMSLIPDGVPLRKRPPPKYE